MDSEKFVYWLQGFFELNDARESVQSLSPKQIQVIRDHLKLCFTKVTPERTAPPTVGFTPADLDKVTCVPSMWVYPSDPKLCGITDVSKTTGDGTVPSGIKTATFC